MMRQKINDFIAGVLLIAGLFLLFAGIVLHFCGSGIPTRIPIAVGAILFLGVFLYAQVREVDDGDSF